jgi:hypothetical protein
MIPQKLKLISLMPLAVVCFALAPSVGAAGLSPAPDGGYPNGTTAEGDFALAILTTGTNNTALGFGALNGATSGGSNTAIGNGALFTGGASNFNVATGVTTLFRNIGDFNTADGYAALNVNTTGIGNTATGFAALNGNDTGIGNTAAGFGALFGSTGTTNTAVGFLAGLSLTAGDNNTYIGAGAGNVAGTESGWIRIGPTGAAVGGTTSKTAIGGIFGASIGAAGTVVAVNASGQLGTTPSSARFKTDIDPMGKSSEVIFSLKPVTFHYKGDETNLPCFGLIAEEVAKVNPGLILKDKEGKPFTVRYEQINAMLLNEFLKEHQTVQELKSIVAKQEATAAQQQKQMEALTATVQKVSAQVELNKPAPRTVNNQ